MGGGWMTSQGYDRMSASPLDVPGPVKAEVLKSYARASVSFNDAGGGHDHCDQTGLTAGAGSETASMDIRPGPDGGLISRLTMGIPTLTLR